MRKLLHSRLFYIISVLLLIVVVIILLVQTSSQSKNQVVTTVVETGAVRQLVSVSGIAEAEKSADLAFPVSGIVASVSVQEGDVVETGDELIRLENDALQADRQDAMAALAKAVADRDELLAGPSESERSVTDQSLARAIETLETTRQTEERKIENARRALLSNNLTAFSDDENEEATPPTISGTYACDSEGVYTIDVFRSSAKAGFSYRLAGLENDTSAGSVDQSVPLGTCGLRIQFDADSNYSGSFWTIEIPNTKSSTYTTVKNAYDLAVTQATTAIALAEKDVALAEATADNNNAPARIEEVARANAAIAQAEARIARIDARLEDTVLRAPFSGTITTIDILTGETVTTAPVVTLLAESEFDITARIPEIDIGKLEVGQSVEMVFDARPDATVTGAIDFISLKATEIDGVAYYEANITLDEIPSWIRSGLNADIDIIIEETIETLKVPKRFLIETPQGYKVYTYANGRTATTSVELLLEGNDGFVAITGVTEGDTLIAP